MLPVNNTSLIAHITDCKAGKIVQRVTERVASNPRGIGQLQRVGDNFVPIKPTLLKNFTSALSDLFFMPRRLSADLAKKLNGVFPDNNLFKKYFNLKHVQNHISRHNLKNDLGALRGIYDSGQKIVEKTKGLSGKACDCGKNGKVCDSIADNLNKALNEALAWGKPKYATQDERFMVRLVTGFTAAMFMGKDFMNKALMLGKSEKEAKKDKNHKIKQEVVANTGEAISQFCFLATFPMFANKNKLAGPVIGAGIAFAFNIISRLATGMPLKRNKAPLKPLAGLDVPKGVEDFANKVKTNTFEKGHKRSLDEPDLTKKKSILSPKNILLACTALTAVGFGLRWGKFKLGESEKFQKLVKQFDSSWLGEKIALAKSKQVEKIYTNLDEVDKLIATLDKVGEGQLGKSITAKLDGQLQGAASKEILVGTRRTILKGPMETRRAELNKLFFAIPDFVKNVLTFPYKKTVEVLEGLSEWKKTEKIMKKTGIADFLRKTGQVKLTDDSYGVKNIFLRFQEFEKKHAKDPDGLVKAFGKCLQEAREASVNSVSVSKVSNGRLSAIAQVLGMITGIGFNMSDDFNKTLDNGGTKKEADKAAKLRGLNKFTRTSAQVVIAGIFNGIFKKYYNASLAASAAITFAATVTTDITCRALLGMPFKKMSREEQLAYKEKQQKGFTGKYFKLIDKLSD
ncbi:hypothetical protein tpqmel_0410 [Candidatus Gastranaerophilus sp. (ex Termes propinquus)]|nr:hypothetical protein tpqmel_0410 [Candidatus Gastranaerophilus sp. (ex Termes propinquus)]